MQCSNCEWNEGFEWTAIKRPNCIIPVGWISFWPFGHKMVDIHFLFHWIHFSKKRIERQRLFNSKSIICYSNLHNCFKRCCWWYWLDAKCIHTPFAPLFECKSYRPIISSEASLLPRASAKYAKYRFSSLNRQQFACVLPHVLYDL